MYANSISRFGSRLKEKQGTYVKGFIKRLVQRVKSPLLYCSFVFYLDYLPNNRLHSLNICENRHALWDIDYASFKFNQN